MHDALHAQVDSWNSVSPKDDRGDRRVHGERDELWKRVIELEKTCRNPKPTVLNTVREEELTQLETPPYATSFDELLNVLSG